MRKTIGGFTIVEIIVAIFIMGLLSSIGFVSYGRVQASERNAIRSTRITTIANALEKYYLQNGEYPSCLAMSKTSSLIATDTLKGIDTSALSMPKSSSKGSSILSFCGDVSAVQTEIDPIIYTGNRSVDCLLGYSCSGWILKYKDELTGGLISLNSKRGTGATTGLTEYITAPWTGNNKTTCSTWTAPSGKIIKDFYVSHVTESGYDFVTVSANSVEKYRGSGTVNSQKIDISSEATNSMSVCITADSSVQDGYGGMVYDISVQ
ncbi:hypothetical protein CVV43_05405 [Candidatus Saccharibacteria bacterium HGW-Saccharibacteria-1]|jgi:Tfp pilus assembly protein PilE|nr:MAG: hypothetical protein CVV43_05405 [Candidatus Saccharibacteria bacterium HGW-Saccharibacteria-1]